MNDPQDLLTTLLDWFGERSQPNKNRDYYSCPVCYATWRNNSPFSKERHNSGCWVPQLQEMVKRAKEQG